MEAFKNFKIAAYVYAYYLKDADDAEIQRGIDYFTTYIHLDEVYIRSPPPRGVQAHRARACGRV